MSTSDAVLVGIVDGERVAYVGPQLHETYPPLLLEGLVRRRLVATTGVCPCGARMVVPNRAARRAAARTGQAVMHVRVEHEDDCPAVDARVDQLGGCQ